MWQRWNQSTHIFEKSDDNGAIWVPLPLSSAILTEGIVNPDRLGSGTPDLTKFLRGDSTWQLLSSISPAVPDASETVKGIIELATAAEVIASADAVRAITPATHAPWANYTPVWSWTGGAVSLGNGTLTGRWCRIGKLVHFKIYWTAGSTTTFGTGTGGWEFTLPIATVTTFIGVVRFVDVTPFAGRLGVCWNGGAGVTPFALTTGFVTASVNAISPHTWAVNDSIVIEGTYEGA